MHIGKQIKYYRQLQGYTQKRLAEECGLAIGTIQQYELEKREPKLEMLMKIVDVLNISMDTLLGYSSQPDNYTFPADDEIALLRYYHILNEIGKAKAIEQVEMLTKIHEYKK